MNYEETCEFLFSRLPMYQRVGKAAYKANLNTTIAIDEYFDHPHKTFATVHIAGTNGKGSVAHILAAILQEAGYKTALYTSPHLLDFRERIKINGKCIPKQQVVEFVELHYNNIEHLNPSFFELSVAMAFDYFAREAVDIAIIETGMGGRLDSTNIITPKLSVITNISKDHTQFLGNELVDIATEKAGIIKQNVPVVVGQWQTEVEEVFEKRARELNADILFADKEFAINYSMTSLSGKQVFQVYRNGEMTYPNLEIDLLGIYQKYNVMTVLKSLEVLNNQGIKVDTKDIYSGASRAAEISQLQGRWQSIGHNPRIVCDTGHNEAGIESILTQIKTIPYKKLHLVLGVVNDKNVDKILSMMPKEASYYFCKASIPRALDENQLRDSAMNYGLKGKAFASVEMALQDAKHKADKDDFIFVGGSTFVVADCLKSIQDKIE